MRMDRSVEGEGEPRHLPPQQRVAYPHTDSTLQTYYPDIMREARYKGVDVGNQIDILPLKLCHLSVFLHCTFFVITRG